MLHASQLLGRHAVGSAVSDCECVLQRYLKQQDHMPINGLDWKLIRGAAVPGMARWSGMTWMVNAGSSQVLVLTTPIFGKGRSTTGVLCINATLDCRKCALGWSVQRAKPWCSLRVQNRPKVRGNNRTCGCRLGGGGWNSHTGKVPPPPQQPRLLAEIAGPNLFMFPACGGAAAAAGGQ